MAITYVQGDEDGAETNPASCTFPVSPTSGNLLIYTIFDRGADATPTMDASGWTEIIDNNYQKGDSDERQGAVTWAKISDGSESGAITADNGGSDWAFGVMTEWAPTAGSTFVALTGSEPQGTANTTVNGTEIQTPTSGSASTDTNLVYASTGIKNNGNNGFTSVAYTTINLTERLNAITDAAGGGGLSCGGASDTSTGTKTTTMTWDNAASATRGMTSHIIVFAEEIAGGGDPEAALVGGKLLAGGMLTAGGNLVGR